MHAAVGGENNNITMSSQKDLLNQAKDDYGVGGNADFFQFDKAGEYRFRQLTAGFPLATHFFGKGMKAKVCYGTDKGCPFHGAKAPQDDKGNEKKPSVKFICYVLDRRDGKIKLAELPYSVIKVVTDLQEDSDYAFEDFPAPYDLKVTFDKEASPADMYKTLPSPKIEPLTAEQADELEEKMKKITPSAYVEKRKEKQRDSDLADASYDGIAEEQFLPEHEVDTHDVDYPEYSGAPSI